MGILLVLGFLVGGAAFLFGGLIALATLLAALGRMLRGQFALVGKQLLLFAACAAILAGCGFLMHTQPVEYPWHPLHIPIYAMALAAFLYCRRLQLHWESQANGTSRRAREQSELDP